MSDRATTSRQEPGPSDQVLREQQHQGRRQQLRRGEEAEEESMEVIVISEEENESDDNTLEGMELIDVDAMPETCECARKRPVPYKSWRDQMERPGKKKSYLNQVIAMAGVAGVNFEARDYHILKLGWKLGFHEREPAKLKDNIKEYWINRKNLRGYRDALPELFLPWTRG